MTRRRRRSVAPLAAVLAAALAVPARTPLPAGGPAAAAVPAPIEGFGAVTAGGAGKPACVVTSLADGGPGTLRECLSGGHRHVRFVVAGIIALASQLDVHGPFVTIDGFTAPPPGITLSGAGLNIWDSVSEAHDVVVRGLRIRSAGALTDGKSSQDCIGLDGRGVYNVVIDHVSIHDCADGGIDISAGPKNITIQWSIVSAAKAMLWGSTSSSADRETSRISMHHTMLICGATAAGCDRFPLIRASGSTVMADLRRNVFQGWLRANGTKIEPAAWVNVVGNAYIPRADATLSQRQGSLDVQPGTKVYTADNVELGPAPRPDLNEKGNQARPMPAPPITARALGCVVRDAGMHPRDAVDTALLAHAAAVPAECDEE